MIFFGKYRGTFRSTGFYWVNPFMTAKKVSLRLRNMDIAPIKVNDKEGNPVMIGMVMVWKVKDTYRVIFDIDANDETTDVNENGKVVAKVSALQNFVSVQSDAALREVTGNFAYDDNGNTNDELTLRGGSHEIVELLEKKLNERLSMAGIEVVEARLNYLAYAPEIAAVMLRRQQASAIISTRKDCRGRSIYGQDGTRPAQRRRRCRTRRGAQGYDGKQPARGALRRRTGTTRRKHRHSL